MPASPDSTTLPWRDPSRGGPPTPSSSTSRVTSASRPTNRPLPAASRPTPAIMSEGTDVAGWVRGTARTARTAMSGRAGDAVAVVQAGRPLEQGEDGAVVATAPAGRGEPGGQALPAVVDL